MTQILVLCITCKLLTKVQEFQVHVKNWQKTVCGFGLHQKENFDQIIYKQHKATILKHLKQHLSILEEYPTLK